MRAPMPRPITAIETPLSQAGVSWRSRDRPARPRTRNAPPPTRKAFQRPVRLMIWPAIVDESIAATMSGMVMRPALVGL